MTQTNTHPHSHITKEKGHLLPVVAIESIKQGIQSSPNQNWNNINLKFNPQSIETNQPNSPPQTPTQSPSRKKQGFVLCRQYVNNEIKNIVSMMNELQNQINILNERVEKFENRVIFDVHVNPEDEKQKSRKQTNLERREQIRTKQSLKQYKCCAQKCGKTFKSYSSLYVHYKCKHPCADISKAKCLVKENQGCTNAEESQKQSL